MKKFLIFCTVLFVSFNLFAQSKSSAVSANRKTAERCLRLAENCLLALDYTNAMNQAEMGLAYDDSISDLFYIEAVAKNHLGYKVFDVLSTIEIAFEKNKWINYNENNGRILYADLLCDTGDYNKSLEVLDRKPLIYSSDAEFIRIKNYYRLGDEDSITQARKKLSSARKIYSEDVRFPSIFFMFETCLRLCAENNGEEYSVPEFVQNIADAYIAKITDYKNPDVEMELLALLFSDGEQQTRLLKAVGEKNRNTQLFALAGLRTGIISEDTAYHLYFEDKTEFQLEELDNFILNIKSEEIRRLIFDYMNSFDGTLKVDNNHDLLSELVVKYSRGRPEYITYDLDSDGINELYAVCDFGVPLSVNFSSQKTDLFYESYPAVKKVVDYNDGTSYTFLDADYKFTPFVMETDKIMERFDVQFYVPYIFNSELYPDSQKMLEAVTTLEIPTTERAGSKAVYTMFMGKPVFVSFSDGVSKYAYCSMEGNLPYCRYVDYDNDGTFETIEYFNILDENSILDATGSGEKVFGSKLPFAKLDLKKIEIDRNMDTVMEYSMELLEHNGKIISWDDDNNGIVDIQNIRYPDSYGEDGKLLEETIFYDTNGLPYVVLKNIDSVPVSITTGSKEIPVVKGYSDEVFWLEAQGTEAQEEILINNREFRNGVVVFVEIEKMRFSVIKIGKQFFCSVLPASNIEEGLEETAE
ncbi:MAG: hypothetical protein MJ162_03020 [Treponema sp.]|nr:hypothetical protein [Treponema sp.]